MPYNPRDPFASLAASLGDQYLIQDDPEDPTKKHFRSMVNASESMTLRMQVSPHENVAGPVIEAMSEGGRLGKPIVPQLTSSYNRDTGAVEYDLQGSAQRTAGLISQAFSHSRENPGVSPESAFWDLITRDDEYIGNQALGSSGRNVYPAASAKAARGIQVNMTTSQGGSPLPMERRDIIDNMRSMYGRSFDPIGGKSGTTWEQLRSKAFAFDERGYLLPTSERTIYEGSPDQFQPEKMKASLFRTPQKALKALSIESGTGIAAPYTWKGGQLVPMQAQPTAPGSRPAYAQSNVLFPGESEPRQYERATTLFTPVHHPGGAIAYHNENALRPAVWGEKSFQSNKLGITDLRTLASEDVKIGVGNIFGKKLSGGRPHTLGTLTMGGETENISMEAGAQNFYPQSAVLNIPQYMDPITGKAVRGVDEGGVSTASLAKAIREQQGLVVRRGNVGSVSLDIGGVAQGATSFKGGGVKAGEVLTGLEQNLNVGGINIGLTHATQEMKADTALGVNFMGGMSTRQIGKYFQDFARTSGIKGAGELAEIMQSAEGPIRLDAAAERLRQASGGEWQGTGFELANKMFESNIYNVDMGTREGRLANRRNLRMYGAGYAPGQEFKLGVYHPEAYDAFVDMQKRAFMAQEGATEEGFNKYMYKTFRTEGQTEGGARVLYQRGTENQMVVSHLQHRKMEYAGTPRANPEFMRALTNQFPELAQASGMSIEQLPRTTPSQRAFAGIMSFMGHQSESVMAGGMKPDTMPTSYTEMDASTQSKLRSFLEASKGGEVADQIAGVTGIMGDKVAYFPGTQTFMPSPGSATDISYSKLGIKAEGLQSSYLRTLKNVLAVNRPDRLEGDAAIDVEAGHEAVAPLYNRFRNIFSAGGSAVKNLMGRAMDVGLSGRYAGDPLLAPEEMQFAPNQREVIAARAGFRGKNVQAAADDLANAGFGVAAIRYPQTHSEAVMSMRMAKESDRQARFIEALGPEEGAKAYQRATYDPRGVGVARVGMAFSVANVGDEDYDPYLAQIAAKAGTGGKWQQIVDPKMEGELLTWQKAKQIESGIHQDPQFRNKVNAYVGQMQDRMQGKDIVGGILKGRNFYGIMDIFDQGVSTLENKGINMGVGYNPRHALGPWMGAAGYSAEESARVMKTLPKMYQPALDQMLVRASDRTASMIASPYFTEYEEDGQKVPYLRVTSSDTFERKRRQITRDGKVEYLPTNQQWSTSLRLDDKGLTKESVRDFLETQAIQTTRPVQMKGGVQSRATAGELASWWARPGEGEHAKLKAAIEAADPEDRGYAIGKYHEESTVEQMLSTPIIGAQLTRATSKAIEGRDPYTGKERIEGSLGVMTKFMDRNMGMLAPRMIGSAYAHDISRSFKNMQMGGTASSIVQQATGIFPEGSVYGKELGRLSKQFGYQLRSPSANAVRDELVRSAKSITGQDPVDADFPQGSTFKQAEQELPDIPAPQAQSDVQAEASGGGSTGGGGGGTTGTPVADAGGGDAGGGGGGGGAFQQWGGFKMSKRKINEAVQMGYIAMQRYGSGVDPLANRLRRSLGMRLESSTPLFKAYGRAMASDPMGTIAAMSPYAQDMKGLGKVNDARARAIAFLDKSKYAGDENVRRVLGLGEGGGPGPMMNELAAIGKQMSASEAGLNPYILSGISSLSQDEGVGRLAGEMQAMGMSDVWSMSPQALMQGGEHLRRSPDNVRLMNQIARYVSKVPKSSRSIVPEDIRNIANVREALNAADPSLVKEQPGGGGEAAVPTAQLRELNNLYAKQAELLGKVNEQKGKEQRQTKAELDIVNQKLRKGLGAVELEGMREELSGIRGQVESYVDRGEKVPLSLARKLRTTTQGIQTLEEQQQEELAADEVGPYGRFARRMFGGFGLMYARSIMGMVTGGLGYGEQQRTGREQAMAGTAYQQLGARNVYYNQQQVLENQMAMNGLNYNPMTGLQQLGAQVPMLQQLGAIGTAGLGAWGYSQFAASTLPAASRTGQFLTRNATQIGAVAGGIALAGDVFGRMQDPYSVGTRLAESRFTSLNDNLAYGAQFLTNREDWGESERGRIGGLMGQMAMDEGFSVSQMRQATIRNRQDVFGTGTDTVTAGDQYSRTEFMRIIADEITRQNPSLSAEAAAQTAAFAQINAPGMSLNDPRLMQIAQDYQMGGLSAQASQQMLLASGRSLSSIYGTQGGVSQLGQMQMFLSGQELDAGQRAIMESGLGAAGQISGMSGITGGMGNQQMLDYYMQLGGMGQKQQTAYISAQNASVEARRAGLSVSTPRIGAYDRDMDEQQFAESMAQSQGIAGQAAYRMNFANQQLQQSYQFGNYETGNQMYQKMTSVEPGKEWLYNRIYSGDPMAMGMLAQQGVQLSGMPGLSTIGGQTIGAEYAAMTDRNLAGNMTGLGWGTTSFQMGNVGAQQMATRMFGTNWQNNQQFSQGLIGAGVQGIQLDAPITLPTGETMSSVGGTMGMALYQNQVSQRQAMEQLDLRGRGMDMQYQFQLKTWGNQDKMRDLQYRQSMFNFDMQERRLGMQESQFQETSALNLQQRTMQRGWTMEDWGTNQRNREMQWAWKQEDFNENVRFQTGRQRRVAERGMRRATVMYNLEDEEITKKQDRQKELWKLEDERFLIQEKYFKENLAMQEESIEKGRQFAEERRKLEDRNIEISRQYAKEQTALQKEQLAAARRNTEENHRLQRTMIQLQMASQLTAGAMNTLADDAFEKLRQALLGIGGAVDAAVAGRTSGSTTTYSGIGNADIINAGNYNSGGGGGGGDFGSFITTTVGVGDISSGGGGSSFNPALVTGANGVDPGWTQGAGVTPGMFAYAEGGTPTPGRVSVAGESGPEFVIDGRIIGATLSKRLASMGVRKGMSSAAARRVMGPQAQMESMGGGIDTRSFQSSFIPTRNGGGGGGGGVQPVVHVYIGNEALQDYVVRAVENDLRS